MHVQVNSTKSLEISLIPCWRTVSCATQNKLCIDFMDVLAYNNMYKMNMLWWKLLLYTKTETFKSYVCTTFSVLEKLYKRS